MADNARKFDFDYFVIGGGSGGVRSARIATQHGAKVGVAEDRDMGGTCVNRGCVPKKYMVFAGQHARAFQDAVDYGWAHEGGKPAFNWAKLRDAVNGTTEMISGKYQSGLDGVEATTFNAHARVIGPHEVVVGNQTVTAEHILIATGGVPSMPDMPGVEHAISSDEVFHLPELPKRLVVAGGGYIALEFASIFNALGSDVTVIYRGPELLKNFDHDLRQQLTEDFLASGIKIRFNTTIPKIEKEGDTLKIHLTDGDVLDADQMLFAIGRRPRIAGLGLDEVGIETNEVGAIKVDEHYRTNIPSIYAVGDVTDRVNLTPVAIREGHWLADQLFGPEGRNKIDYAMVTTAVFTTPELASVGLSEQEAVDAGFDVEVFRTRFRAMRYTLGGNQPWSMMKLVVDRDSDRVLGVHMLGENAAEIIQGLAVAVTLGATKAQFDATVALHPTVAEEFVTMREPAASTLKERRQAAE